MKILQIIPSLNLGGAEVLVAKMAIVLKQLGHDVTVLVFARDHSYLFELLTQGNVEIIVAAVRLPGISQYYSPLNMIWVAKYLRQHHFDVVHAHLTPAQICLALVRVLYRKNAVFVTTEHSAYNRRRKTWFKWFDRFLYAQFDQIIACSEITKDALIAWLPELKSVCRVINNGIDLTDFDPGHRQPLLKSAAKTNLSVVCIARFVPAKGHDVLLRAFAATTGMELYLVGDGGLKTTMQVLTKQLNLVDRVHFLGNRSDIVAILANADIYVQPSLWEGLPIAVLEAMASGLPIIASDAPGIVDAIGDAGWLFPRQNSQKLTVALMSLAVDPALRAKLAKLAKQRSLLFSLVDAVKQYLELYNNAL